MKALMLASVVLVCSAPIAHVGGWQNAAWSMTPAEVRTAIAGGEYPTQTIDV